MDKKDIKPFMVNNAVIAFERGRIALNPQDKKMIKQFEDYHIKSIGTSGRPVFGEQEEHIVDCVMLAIHGFNLKYSDMMKVAFATKMFSIRSAAEQPEEKAIPSRAIESPLPQNHMRPLIASANSNSSRHSRTGFRGRSSMPSRGRF
jgi:replicative DNA helicase